jgi:GxxExxY protein
MGGPLKPFLEDEETFQIIGAAMAVHNDIGGGFLEAVYKWALSIEFEERKIPFAREVKLPIAYHGRVLPVTYRVDFICFGNVIVEIKAIERITAVAHAQTINYVKAAQHERGLLLNFGPCSLQHKRCT